MAQNAINNNTTSLTINGNYTFPTVDGSANQTMITDGAGTLTWRNEGAAGDVVQYVYTSTSASLSTAANIPSDDTIPQISEGAEAITLAITPSSATNRLIIKFNTTGQTQSNPGTLALFQDATTNALAAVQVPNTQIFTSGISYSMVSGTSSSTTFRIRYGANSSNMELNGAGGRMYGGVAATSLEIWEIQV